MSTIIYRYIALQFYKYVAVVFCTIFGIILLFDILELLRVSAKTSEIDFSAIFVMGLFKNYYHANKIWPFIILLATIFTYRQLSLSFEIYALRSAGLSTLQLLYPVLLAALFLGVLHITALNPLGSYLMRQYQHLESTYLNGQKSLITISKSGIWMKQQQENGIVHALRMSQHDRSLHDVTVFYLTENGALLQRVDAKKAQLLEREWVLSQAVIMRNDRKIEHFSEITIPMNINFEKVIENAIDPKVLSFWQLASSAQSDEIMKFTRHKLYFAQLLVSPITFVAIALIGHVFGIVRLRKAERDAKTLIALLVQFLIYSCSDFVSAMALSGYINTALAAIFPALLLTIIGLYLTLHQEFA